MRNYDKIHWQDSAKEYAEMFGISKEDAETIVRTSERYEKDPHSNDLGHLVMRYYAGDVCIVVGHREVKEPIIMHVRMRLPMNDSKQQKRDSGSGSTLPRNMRELKKRILDLGYKIAPGGKHDKVIDPKNGTVVCTVPTTPSEYRSVANVWLEFRRYHTTKRVENP